MHYEVHATITLPITVVLNITDEAIEDYGSTVSAMEVVIEEYVNKLVFEDSWVTTKNVEDVRVDSFAAI